MCGICLVLVKNQRGPADTDLFAHECYQDTDYVWRELLSNRGPDLQGSCHVNMHFGPKPDDILNAEFHGHVLHLRGSPTQQPLNDANGNILLWNGEIFGGNFNVEEHQNDGKELLQKLASISHANSNETIVEVFQQIHGPWAFVYFQRKQKTLWFGRDFFGRRSLLWHLPDSTSETFVLTSAAVKTSNMEFTEVPAKMIYCIKIDQLATALASGDSLSFSNGTKSNSYMTPFPLNIPMHDIKGDILAPEDVRFLCFLENEIRDGVSQLDSTVLNSFRSLKKKIRSLENCVVSTKDYSCPLSDYIFEETLDSQLRENNIRDACAMEVQTKCTGYLTSNSERTAPNVLSDNLNESNEGVTPVVNLHVENMIISTNEPIIPDSKELEPPEGDAEIYKELLEYYTTYFVHYLDAATIRRVYNLPRGDCAHCKHLKINDINFEKNPLEQQQHLSCSSCVASNAAKIGILFSGGIDSMVLAAVADRHVPCNEAIDLLNVAFEQQPQRTNAKIRHRRAGSDPKKDPFEVPDRISGRAGVKELNPRRKWNFVEINITLAEVKAARAKRVRHVVYPLQTVLDDSLGCAIWFASKGKGTNYVHENGELVKIEECYTSNTKVLLAGMGADEQLGGYARHRSKFEKFGWKGLREEIEMEVQRISSRNLGRDDRCISDHGREARFPFLDENVVNFLQKVPVWIKCDPRLQRGYGEKRLLREVARKLGLHGCAILPKRAIQFGSKIAKMENSKEKGSDSCNRLETSHD